MGIGTTTPEAGLHIFSASKTDAIKGSLLIETDPDNDDERHNPIITLTQDAGLVKGNFGVSGNTGSNYTYSISNSVYLQNTNGACGMQFVIGNKAQVTLDQYGNFGIGDNYPRHSLQIYNRYDATKRNAVFFGYNSTWSNKDGELNITTFVGEYGLSDSNELQLHGSNGFKFTTGNYFNGEEIAMELSKDEQGENTLQLNGKVVASEVRISKPLTADFVFEEDYSLRDLSEVENFVKENKHLPEVPSAKDMEQNGVGVAQMNQLLLQKIEELTLYTIQQQKVIEQQGDLLKALDKKLNEL